MWKTSHKHLTNINFAHAVCRSRTARERKRNELDAPVDGGPKLPEQHSFPRNTSLLAFEPLLRISLSLPKANYALLLGGEGGRNAKWEFVDYGWLVMIRVGATRFATLCPQDSVTPWRGRAWKCATRFHDKFMPGMSKRIFGQTHGVPRKGLLSATETLITST